MSEDQERDLPTIPKGPCHVRVRLSTEMEMQYFVTGYDGAREMGPFIKAGDAGGLAAGINVGMALSPGIEGGFGSQDVTLRGDKDE